MVGSGSSWYMVGVEPSGSPRFKLGPLGEGGARLRSGIGGSYVHRPVRLTVTLALTLSLSLSLSLSRSRRNMDMMLWHDETLELAECTMY